MNIDNFRQPELEESENVDESYEDLVATEVLENSRSEILKLKNSVTISRYQNFIRSKQRFLNSILDDEMGLEFLRPQEINELKKILIVIKLWMIKDSEQNYIRVQDLETPVNFNNLSLLNSDGSFRNGLLPVISWLNVRNLTHTRKQDGTLVDLSKSPLSQITIDYSTEPILINFQEELSNGEMIERKYVRVRSVCFLNTQQIQQPLFPMFVPLDTLEINQDDFVYLNFNKSNFENAIETLNFDYVFRNLNRIDEIYNSDKVSVLDDIIQKAELSNNLGVIFQNLALIKNCYGPQGTHKINTIIEHQIENQNWNLIFSSFSQINISFENRGIQKCKQIIDNYLNLRPSSADIIYNLPLIHEGFDEEVGNQIAKYIIDKCIDQSLYLNEMLEILSYIKELYNPQGQQKCLEILRAVLTGTDENEISVNDWELIILNLLNVPDSFNILLENLELIYEAFDEDIRVTDSILNKAQELDLWDYILVNLEIIEETYNYDKCLDLYNRAVLLNKWNDLFKNIQIIDSVLGEEYSNQLVERSRSDHGPIANAMFKYFPRVVSLNESTSQVLNNHLNQMIQASRWSILIPNLNVIRNNTSMDTSDICTQIVEKAKQDSAYEILLSNLPSIKEALGENGTRMCEEIIDDAKNDNYFIPILKNLSVIKTALNIDCQEIIKKIRFRASRNNVQDIFNNLSLIDEANHSENFEVSNLIIDCFMGKFYFKFLIENLNCIKIGLRNRGTAKCEEIVRRGIRKNFFYSLVTNLREVDSVLSTDFPEIIDDIISAMLREKKFKDLIINLKKIYDFYGSNGTEKCEEIIRYILKRKESILVSNKALKILGAVFHGAERIKLKAIINVLIDRYYFMDTSIIQELFDEHYTLQCVEKMLSFVDSYPHVLNFILSNNSIVNRIPRLKLFSSLNIYLEKAESNPFLIDLFFRVNPNIILEFMPENLIHKLIILTYEMRPDIVLRHKGKLIQFLQTIQTTELQESLAELNISGSETEIRTYAFDRLMQLEDLNTIIENSLDLVSEEPELLSLHLKPALEKAFELKDYKVMLKYLPILKRRNLFSRIHEFDNNKFHELIEFSTSFDFRRNKYRVFNTANGFELISSRNSDYEIKQYNHNLTNFNTINSLEPELLHLQELGITYHENIMQPYELLRNVIASRRAFELQDRSFFHGKNFHVVFLPSSDWNGAFKANNNYYQDHTNTLLFEISTEQEMYQHIQQLGEFGVNVDLMMIGGHGSQQRINFGSANDPRFPGYVPVDNLSLEPEDEDELSSLTQNPNVASVLAGSTIILQSCSTGNIRGNRLNMVQLISNTIGSNSIVIGPSLPDNANLIMRNEFYSTRNKYNHTSHFIIDNRRNRSSN